jgi:hypothetical protein
MDHKKRRSTYLKWQFMHTYYKEEPMVLPVSRESPLFKDYFESTDMKKTIGAQKNRIH